METDTTASLPPTIEVKAFQSIDGLALVELLESCGGDVIQFCRRANETGVPAEFIIYQCEKALSELPDKSLYKRWNDSIRLRKLARWRITQEKVFTALEEAANSPSENNKNILDLSKVVLQEFLVQQAQAAKNHLTAKPEEEGEDTTDSEIEEMAEFD